MERLHRPAPKNEVEMHGDALYRFALLRLRDPKLDEDAVQETLLSALQARNRFLGQASKTELAHRDPKAQGDRLFPEDPPGVTD